MIAYNRIWLTNLSIRSQAKQAFADQYITKEELGTIESRYVSGFYSPNNFIRIGLFILTTIIFLFSFGLFCLLFVSSIEKMVGGLAIFFGLAGYAALEAMVKSKNHYQSGVDDALLWLSSICLFAGLSLVSGAGELTSCGLIVAIAGYGACRFTDTVMSLVMYIALLAFFFFLTIRTGALGKALAPFVLMSISVICYALVRKLERLKSAGYYSGCLAMIAIAALLSFYLAGNYYVVKEIGDQLFAFSQAGRRPLPFAWVFWTFTLLVPWLYIIRGILTKDLLLIRAGLVLVAAIVFTVHYYYSIASIELIMTVAGIVLLLVSYGLSRYLRLERGGFVDLPQAGSEEQDKAHLESILLAQTLSTAPAPIQGTTFGGGSFGGGGATGEY
jgi:hypothetical protein